MWPSASYMVAGERGVGDPAGAAAYAHEELGHGARLQPSVLIVEDEHLNALFVAAEFEAAGFAAHIAHDGLEALQVLAKHRVDAVLTDIRMPNMDGTDLVRHLKRSGVTAPILVMTGVPYEAKELPVEEIFPKPLHLPRVIQAVTARIRRIVPSADGSPVASC